MLYRYPAAAEIFKLKIMSRVLFYDISVSNQPDATVNLVTHDYVSSLKKPFYCIYYKC